MKHYDGTWRSVREAFPGERYAAVEGPYRHNAIARLSRVVGYLTVLGLFAGIGVMLAWRG